MPFGIGQGEVTPVAVGGEADHLDQDRRAARARVLELLEHQAARSLARDHAVAIPIEGPRRALRLVVAGGGREQHVEDRRIDRVELLGSARQHDLLVSVLDRLVGVADSLAAGGARARGGDHAPAHPEEAREIRGRGVAHELEVVVGADPAGGAPDEELARVDPDRRRAPGAGAAADAEPARAELRGVAQARLLERQLGGAREHQRDPPHRARLLARVGLGHDEVRHARPEPGGEALDVVPLRNPRHARSGPLAGLRAPASIPVRADRSRPFR